MSATVTVTVLTVTQTKSTPKGRTCTWAPITILFQAAYGQTMGRHVGGVDSVHEGRGTLVRRTFFALKLLLAHNHRAQLESHAFRKSRGQCLAVTW